MSPSATVTRLTPAAPSEQARGLLAYLTIIVGGLRIDGVTLRRDAKGGLRLSYPERVDGAGRRHALVWPVTPEIQRQRARGLKVMSTSWCRIPLPPFTSPRSRMTQYVPLLIRANFAP